MKSNNVMSSKKFDYLIVGAGLFGSVFAYCMKHAGKRCLVIDKRGHIAGNIYCEESEGIRVHKYGPHIFHTSKKRVWDFILKFTEMNHFVYSPLANYQNRLYNLPFNMNTFNQVWGISDPEEAMMMINRQTAPFLTRNEDNMEAKALGMIGTDLYNMFVKGYTEKQWGRNAKELPGFIIKRLPLRFVFDNNYFNDPYQGIPNAGYNSIVSQLLDGVEVKLNTDYLTNRPFFRSVADKTFYTGMIDEFFGFQLGRLEYRSLSFETTTMERENFQGNAAINYTGSEVPFTRIIEHKHFEFGKQKHTVVTREFPSNYNGNNEPYYPVNIDNNSKKYSEYLELAKQQPDVIFGGRLGSYTYINMDETIDFAMELAKFELAKCENALI